MSDTKEFVIKLKKAAAEVAASSWNYDKKLIYFFTKKIIYKNPDCFIFNIDGSCTFIDGTEVRIMPDSMGVNDEGEDVCFIIPESELKPTKFCFEGEEYEILDCFNW